MEFGVRFSYPVPFVRELIEQYSSFRLDARLLPAWVQVTRAVQAIIASRRSGSQGLNIPCDDVKPTGEVRYRREFRELDTEWLGHRVDLQLDLRGLQRPWRMVDVAVAQPASAVYRIKAVSIGEPAIERFWSGTINGSSRFVRCVKLRTGAFSIYTMAA